MKSKLKNVMYYTSSCYSRLPGYEKDVKNGLYINQHSVERISKHLTNNQLVLFASTGSNYGAVKDGVCTEETPLNPLTTYGISKTEAEKIF